jgi:RimJ/RimL family protein N-acetyltransferase
VPGPAVVLPLELRTDRLLLRQWRPVDVGPLAEIYTHPDVIAQLGRYDRDETEAKIERFTLQWKEEGFSLWAAEDLETGRLIGRVGLLRHTTGRWPTIPSRSAGRFTRTGGAAG